MQITGQTLARTCSLVASHGERSCPRDAVVHWTDMWGNEGGACEHHQGTISKQRLGLSHEVGPCCGMPGSHWDYEENVCRYEEDELPVTQEKELELVG